MCSYCAASPRMNVSSPFSSIRSRMVRVVMMPSLSPSRQSHSQTGSRCALPIRWNVYCVMTEPAVSDVGIVLLDAHGRGISLGRRPQQIQAIAGAAGQQTLVRDLSVFRLLVDEGSLVQDR